MTTRETKQKQEILQVVSGVNCHMTAEEVHQALVARDSGIGIATVYRNLNRLVEANIISRIADREICYYDGNSTPHYHLRCMVCNKFEDAPLAYLDLLDQSLVEKGIGVRGHSITFDWICPSCQTHDE